MGASTLQAAVSRRVATGPEVAAAISSADATLAEAAFILDHDDDHDGCRAATAARVLIARNSRRSCTG